MSTSAYTDGYRAFDFKDLSGGLNLRDKADVVNEREAIDLLNVTFSERGAIRQREGFLDLGPVLTNRVDSMAAHYTTAGLRQIMLGAGTRVEVMNDLGNVIAAQTGRTRGPYQFAQFGDPTRELVYCANGADPLLRWDGASFALGTALATVNGVAGQALPRAGAVCVTASTAGQSSGTNASNRMVATAYGTQVAGGPGGAQSTPSRVHFSNAGQPEVWEIDGDPGVPGTRAPRGRNFVDLTPGDGESIVAAVTWRELVFVFKQTKFFVLWGEGVGAEGTPTFQVREVVNSIGLASPQAVAVGRDGVYFMNRRGLYRTSGGDPALLSDVISPMWTQDPDVYFRSSPINLAALDQVRALWSEERFYLAVPTGASTGNDRVLVYDTQHGWWSLYDWPAAALVEFRSGDRPEVHFGYSSPLPQQVGHQRLGVTDDRGQAIVSRWRSGWGDYGSTQVKTIRETKLWGTGTAVVSFSTDFFRSHRASIDTHFGPVESTWTYAQLTARGYTYAELDDAFLSYATLAENLPITAAVEDALVRYATRGVVFSMQFANSPTEPSWSVHRVARHLREIREASVSAT